MIVAETVCTKNWRNWKRNQCESKHLRRHDECDRCFILQAAFVLNHFETISELIRLNYCSDDLLLDSIKPHFLSCICYYYSSNKVFVMLFLCFHISIPNVWKVYLKISTNTDAFLSSFVSLKGNLSIQTIFLFDCVKYFIRRLKLKYFSDNYLNLYRIVRKNYRNNTKYTIFRCVNFYN